MEHIISLKNITKKYGSLVANDDISIDINKGEVLAIVGENGAGKSTLMKILYGLEKATSGDIFIKGEKINSNKFNSGLAIKKGIGMIHQHFMLIPSFTIAENVVLGHENRKLGIFVDKRKNIKKVQDLSCEYNLSIDCNEVVSKVSVGIQQRTEILKSFYRNADILILDEPTAVLTPQETSELFTIIKSLVKEKQLTVIIITHKLNEVMQIADRVAVMRKGQLVLTDNIENVTEKSLAQSMVGRNVLLNKIARDDNFGDVFLEVNNLNLKDENLYTLKDINLKVRSGEILGIAGVEGNGQSELIEIISGLKNQSSGDINILNTNTKGFSVNEIRNLGVSYIPEDRLLNGVSVLSTVEENLLLGKQHNKEFNDYKIQFNKSNVRENSNTLIQDYDIKTESPNSKVGSLSGGNMQKVIIAREFSFDSKVFLISQPTRGVDIGAIEFIHKKIIEKRNEGYAILLVSAELDELLRLSDTICTIYDGEITATFNREQFDREEIGYYMTGKRGDNIE